MTTRERLIWLRTQHGISQRALARRAGVSHKSISQYERGIVDADAMELARAGQLARALGVSIAVLSGELPLPATAPVLGTRGR